MSLCYYDEVGNLSRVAGWSDKRHLMARRVQKLDSPLLQVSKLSKLSVQTMEEGNSPACDKTSALFDLLV